MRPTTVRLLLVLPTCCTLACRSADVQVISATDLGPLETTAAVKARDGGSSTAFQGRSMWLYGDTVLSVEGEDGSSWRNNTWSWTEDLEASDGITGYHETVDSLGAPLELFPQTDEEAAFNAAHAGEDCLEQPCGARYALWPMDAVEDPERGRALVFFVKIYGEPGEWNFWDVGCGLAAWADPDGRPERSELRPEAEHPTTLFDEDEPCFGAAAMVEDDWLYTWSCESDGWLDKPCKLARVPLKNALERDAWTFYAGRQGWSADVQEAQAVFDGDSQLTVAWNEHLQRYLALYARWGANALYLRTATAPEGPWSDEIKAMDAEPPPDNDDSVYCGYGHGEFTREDGRLLTVSYFRSLEDWTGEIRLVELEVDGP